MILAHAYFHEDKDIIGDVVERDVPATIRASTSGRPVVDHLEHRLQALFHNTQLHNTQLHNTQLHEHDDPLDRDDHKRLSTRRPAQEPERSVKQLPEPSVNQLIHR